MWLKKIVFNRLGPFYLSATLDIEYGVTVLTGSNDTGKTSALNYIEMCLDGSSVEFDDINDDYSREIVTDWRQDAIIGCEYWLVTTNVAQNWIRNQSPNALQVGDEIELFLSMAPNIESNHKNKIRYFHHKQSGHRSSGSKHSLQKRIRVFRFPLSDQIGDEIDLASSTPLEKIFLQQAFGMKYESRLRAQNPARRRRDTSIAEDRLNRKLAEILPSSMATKIRLDWIDKPSPILTIGVEDKVFGHTPISFRGAGLRLIITILTRLMDIENASDNCLILYDEPENSLHPDAQHHLSAFLERLANKDTIQIIYATHSPSMINSFRPESIRVFSREVSGEVPTSIIRTYSVDNNFEYVRMSLGMTPADSLLYAPLSIVVEGATDAISLSRLLHRLYEFEEDRYADLPQIISLCHFVAGQGNLKGWCRLAVSQGNAALIFADGDNSRESIESRLGNELAQDVPIVLLPQGKEIEDIVPLETYFEALRHIVPEQNQWIETTDLTIESFNQWCSGSSANKKLIEYGMLSKKVEGWLKSFDSPVVYRKPDVMRKAVELLDIDQLQAREAIDELIAGLRELAQQLNLQ